MEGQLCDEALTSNAKLVYKRARTNVSDYAALATDVTIRRSNIVPRLYACLPRILCHDLGYSVVIGASAASCVHIIAISELSKQTHIAAKIGHYVVLFMPR